MLTNDVKSSGVFQANTTDLNKNPKLVYIPKRIISYYMIYGQSYLLRNLNKTFFDVTCTALTDGMDGGCLCVRQGVENISLFPTRYYRRGGKKKTSLLSRDLSKVSYRAPVSQCTLVYIKNACAPFIFQSNSTSRLSAMPESRHFTSGASLTTGESVWNASPSSSRIAVRIYRYRSIVSNASRRALRIDTYVLILLLNF